MTRLEKKCFAVSMGLHAVLLLVMVGTSAFSSKPEVRQQEIITMLNAPVTDQQGSGGGSPGPVAPPTATQMVAPPKPQPVHQQAPHKPQPVAEPIPKPEPVRQVEAPPKPVEPPPTTEPVIPTVKIKPTRNKRTKPVETAENTEVKPKSRHEIKPTFEEAKPSTSKSRTKVTPTTSDASDSQDEERAAVAAAASARRVRNAIGRTLDSMAKNVSRDGAQGIVVDMPSEGGGAAFVGYETFIFNKYYHAWLPPESVANKLASVDVKIVVARDGTILSAEIVNKSGESGMDRSVQRVLQAVTKLPPFPATAHDDQRSFLIRFNLDAKEGSG